MSKCPYCGQHYPGLAANCPACGRALPAVGWTSPVGPGTKRRTLAPRVIGILVGLLVGGIVLVAGFYIDLVSNFCLDLNSQDGDQCARSNENFTLILEFVVIPLSATAGIATGMALTRALRRRERRRAS